MKKILFLVLLFSQTALAQTRYFGVDPVGIVPKTPSSNLLIRSEELDVVAGYTLTGVTLTANNTIAPDGATTAELVTASVGTSVKRIVATSGTNRPLSAGAGSRYRSIIYAKAGTHRFIAIGDNGDDVGRFVTVDLLDCSIGLNSGNISSQVFPVSNGFCEIETIGQRTDVCGGCKNLALDIYMVASKTTAANTTLAATGTETVWIWGALQNLSTTANADYVQTTTVGITTSSLCPFGTMQSLRDPSKCFALSPVLDAMWTGSSSHVRPY